MKLVIPYDMNLERIGLEIHKIQCAECTLFLCYLNTDSTSLRREKFAHCFYVKFLNRILKNLTYVLGRIMSTLR